MKHVFLLIGAAALSFSAATIAKPGGGTAGPHGTGMAVPHGNAHAMAVPHGNAHATAVARAHDNRDARGIGLAGRHSGKVGFGAGGCPPGLAKKSPACMPPGHAKKLFRVGQHYNTTLGRRYGFGQIPDSLRNQYNLTPRYRYYYNNGYLYQVNPRTMVVQQVISALLGR